MPVLSHPERNAGFIRNPQRLFRLIEMGAMAQVTAASLLGRFGEDIQRFTVFLMEHRMVHVLATDAHSSRARTPQLAAARRETESLLGKEAAQEMVHDTPLKILRGETVQTAQPLPIDDIPHFPFWKRALHFFMPRGSSSC